MALKIFIVLAFAALTTAVEYKGYSPAKELPVYKKVIEESPAEYEFAYAVHDEHTKDIKMQQESRKGDMVKGRYELIDSDGFKRIVDYTADKHNGFQAQVHREKTNIVVPIPEPKLHKVNYYHQHEPQHEHYASNHQQYESHHHQHYEPVVHHHQQQYAPIVKKPIEPVGKITYASPAKVVVPVSQPKYLAPIIQKATYVQPAVKYIAPKKPVHQYEHGHAATHVTFHGSDTSYQY